MTAQKGYTRKELEEFKSIILTKLETTKVEVKSYQQKLKEISENMGKMKIHGLEDSPEVEERESINYQIKRLESFGKKLYEALHRIQKGTYGICISTGLLIPKNRLRLVPHATLSVQAKNSRID